MFLKKGTPEEMPPDNHLIRTVSNIVKINESSLTENNLILSNAAKTDNGKRVKKKAKIETLILLLKRIQKHPKYQLWTVTRSYSPML